MVRLVGFVALGAVALLAPTSFAAKGDIESIDLWTRARGQHADHAMTARPGLRSVSIAGLKVTAQKLMDPQYGRVLEFRGINLADLTADHPWKQPKTPDPDTLLLHFANGMIIPVNLRDASTREIWIARDLRDGSGWSRKFPPRPKDSDEVGFSDPRPITFLGSKVIFAGGLPNKGPGAFSPWRHCDTLVGIEGVELEAYQRQFPKGPSDKSARGRDVFFARCQTCHGVRGVGASRWDYVDPIPVYKRRQPEHLFNHVGYKKSDAAQRGLMMPPQKDVRPEEMVDLWHWLKAVAEIPLAPYS